MLLLKKLKDVIFSVVPIVIIVLIINFTIVPLGTDNLIRFLIGAFLVIFGLALFLVGVDIGITPMGQLVGSKFAKSNKIVLVIFLSLTLGFIISLAEPSLRILSHQVETVTQGNISSQLLVVIVSIGIGVFVALGLLHILYDYSLIKILFFSYFVILILTFIIPLGYTAIAFDASGATTGSMTVPFILALAVGAASMKKNGNKSEEDSFGLLGIASVGAILTVVILALFNINNEPSGSLPSEETQTGILEPFLNVIPGQLQDTAIAILPILVFFLIFQFLFIKLKKKPLIKILKGLVYNFIGLVIFLTGVNAGFMDTGRIIGLNIKSDAVALIVAFVLGFVTVAAEPAVHVLTNQIEEITNGYVNRRIVLGAFSIAVAIATTLSIVRIIVPKMELWHILLPGYVISLALMFFTPKLFVGIAFDSGGVASGPMNATFIFAFSQGVAFRNSSSIPLTNAFGVISLVALTPLITIQILGLIYKIKTKRRMNNES